MLFLFCVVIAGVNFVVTFGIGKLFGMKLEDLTISVEAALMAIVGGSGTVVGPFVGSAVVLGLQNWVSSFFELHTAVMGAVFIATVLWAPNGLVGIARKLNQRSGEGEDQS